MDLPIVLLVRSASFFINLGLKEHATKKVAKSKGEEWNDQKWNKPSLRTENVVEKSSVRR